MIEMKKAIKRACAVLLAAIMFLTMVNFDFLKVFADEEGKVTSVLMTYNDTQYDVFNDLLEVSTDYDESLAVDFSISGDPENVASVEFYAETEDGTQKKLWSDDKGQTHAELELQDLIPDGGIRMIVNEKIDGSVTKTDDIMLGVEVAEGKNHERYTTEIPYGPDQEVDIDMSGLMPGMNTKMFPDKIPVEYRKFPDGRSVIGLGMNADNEDFWDAAKNGEFHKYSIEELKDLYTRTYAPMPEVSLELRWVIVGYAVCNDDDPDSMTGVIQSYTGATASMTQAVDSLRFGITITADAGTDEVFVMKPDDDPTTTSKDEFLAELDLNSATGAEIFAGIGWPCCNACVYGGATLTSEGNVYPRGELDKQYIDGSVSFKVKFLGYTVYEYKFLDGHKDLYPKTLEDGTVVYRTDLDLCKENEDAVKELLAKGYGNSQYVPVEPEGEQVWLGGSDLSVPDKADSNEAGDSPSAKKIASNVYPESGIQVAKMDVDNNAMVAFISNNNDRTSGNKGELSWMVYDNDEKTITEPVPVATDIDRDRKEDTGADFDPILRRNMFNHKIYAAWKRDRDDAAANRTLTNAAQDFRLCFAEYDEYENEWSNATVLMDDPDTVIGGVAMGMTHPDSCETSGSDNGKGDNAYELLPSVYVYTNPAEDPAGLDPESVHELLVFREDNSGSFKKESLGSVTGCITSFDGGYYNFDEMYSKYGQALAYTVEDSNGQSNLTVMNTDGDFDPVTFENAKNCMFVEGYKGAMDELVLCFTKDGALYTSRYNGDSEKQYPTDENDSMPEVPYKVIGNIDNGSAILGYLTSNGGSQNVRGFMRSSDGAQWYNTQLTNMDENANVSYYGGAFFDNDEPMLIYTVQNYDEQDGNGESGFVDGSADMYIQVGEVNTHVSIESADVTNLEDLGADDTDASVSMLVWNNGLQPVNKVTAYAKKPDDTEYTEAGEFTFEGDDTLLPGEERVITFDVDGDFSEPATYTVSAVGSSDTYERTDIQTSAVLDVPAGRVRLTSADYTYRNVDHDTCEVTAVSKGPGKKSGSLVVYNADTEEVYEELPFQDLEPGATVNFEITNPDGYMSDAYPNMRVKILMDGETLNDAQPQVDDLAVRTVPSWYIDPNHVKPDPESTVQTGTEATDPATTDPAAAGPAATDSPGTDSVATNPAAAKSI